MKRPSLISSRTVRKSRMTLMVASSVLAHTVLVAVGSMIHWPEKKEVITLAIPPDFLPADEEPGQPAPPAGTPVVAANPPSDPEPETLVPVNPDNSEVSTPAPTPRVVRTPTRTVRTTSVTPRTGPTGPQTTAVGSIGTGGGTSATGIGRGQIGWKTPHPPYPARARSLRVQGSTTVRVTTDASGNVSGVVIVKSAGNILLDSATQSYVRSNWKGPANSTHTTEFVYQIP